MEQYDYVPVTDQMRAGHLIGKIGFCSKLTPLAAMLVGVILLLTKMVFGYICGIAVIALAVVVFLKIKDHDTVLVYDDRLLLLNDEDQQKGVVLPIADIAAYDYADQPDSKLWFEMSNGQRLSVVTFRKWQAANMLRSLLNGKSVNDKRVATLKKLMTRNKTKKPTD